MDRFIKEKKGMKIMLERSSNPKRSFKSVLFNQIVFCFSYWLILFCLFYSLRVFFFDKDISSCTNSLIGFANICYLTCATIFGGLTPFLISAFWCVDNPFYQKMVGNRFLLKVIGYILSVQLLLFLINVVFPGKAIANRFYLSSINAILIPLYFMVLYYVRCHNSVRLFARRKGEKHNEWEGRIGLEAVQNIANVRIPTISVPVAFLIIIFIMGV